MTVAAEIHFGSDQGTRNEHIRKPKETRKVDKRGKRRNENSGWDSGITLCYTAQRQVSGNSRG